jgi:peroxiredoxin Q/BCP
VGSATPERVPRAPGQSSSASLTASPRSGTFKGDYELPFTLLADPDHAAAEAYGVWAEKSRYGRTYMGIVRSTFVIGPDGNVAKIMRNVKPATHADYVLAVLER